MRLAQISDFHCTKLTLNPLRLFPKRIFGHFHWIFQRKNNFSLLPLEEMAQLLSNLKVDLLLLGGDFTSSSMEEEFLFAKSLLKEIKAPSIALPGNHDHYTLQSHKEGRFYNYFTNPNPTLGSLAEMSVEAQKIDASWWVVSLDTAIPNKATSSRGLFSQTIEENLKKILSQIPKEEKIILFNHFPFFPQENPKRILERGDALERLIEQNPNIALYLHGHTHRHCVADLRPSGLPIILDSGSLCQKINATWNLIDLTPDRCIVTPYEWKEKWEPKETKEFIWK